VDFPRIFLRVYWRLYTIIHHPIPSDHIKHPMQMVADGCSMSQSYGGFLYLGVSKNCWFKMTKPIKIDDLGVPVFQETTICVFLIPYIHHGLGVLP
jgi:hypothetical protein